MQRSYGDLISGSVLAALGVFISASAWQWEYYGEEGPGAGFFPLWIGLALVSVSLWQVALALGRRPQGARPRQWQPTMRAFAAWSAFALAVALLKPLGFVIAFALVTLFIVCVMFGRRFATSALVAVGSAAAFFLVFVIALGLKLPAGPFGF